jgi:hypothetical protein
MNWIYYVVADRNGKLYGVDKDSGGYPFETKDLRNIELFRNKEDAEEYARGFDNSPQTFAGRLPFSVKELRAHTE